MSVWFCIPSARPPQEAEPVLDKWREQGYKIALRRDPASPIQCDLLMTYPYEGWVHSVNTLVQEVLRQDSSCDWVVTGGDDYWPDPNHRADEIALECSDWRSDTFGVMQPTGDRWGDCQRTRAQYGEDRGAYIDRIAGSPWMGREFCRRMYGGKGPLWPEFYHMYADEHLQNVAERLGIYWQRRDLCQLHMHWGRSDGALADRRKMPEFLASVNTPQHFAKEKSIFDRLKAGGFAEAHGH